MAKITDSLVVDGLANCDIDAVDGGIESQLSVTEERERSTSRHHENEGQFSDFLFLRDDGRIIISASESESKSADGGPLRQRDWMALLGLPTMPILQI